MSTVRTIYLSDTTLRDGEQMPGAALAPGEKVEIARALARAGVASIDAGFPASAASEVEAVRRIAREVPGPVISALCRVLPADVDRAAEALADVQPECRAVSLFVATSPLHREKKLRRSVPELLGMVRAAVEYARRTFHLVAFSPEDATRTEPDVLCAFYREAIDAGARAVGFPDTVGVLAPDQVRDTLRMLQDRIPGLARVAVVGHFHNDLGLATANTLAALREGVASAQCTVNGIGERAGNTPLEEIAVALALHGPRWGLATSIALDQLQPLSRLVARLTGIPLPANKAVVGANQFATAAGIHQDGLLKDQDTYLPYRPDLVGAAGVTLVLGRHSGRAAFAAKLAALGLTADGPMLDRLIEYAKDAPKSAWVDPDAVLRSAHAAAQSSGSV
ncbi:MAG TPA: hypothetical protein VHR66_11105 [Gemmataceae bacterium]|jgi:2-isopropylmalate synthase|nr:hypothetical protein [Gemmataceae bacterium]